MLRLRRVETSRGNLLSVATVAAARTAGPPRPPVLLVHPINLRKECWLGMLPALAAERGCVLVDLAGHGESTDDDEFSLAAWVSDCVDLVSALGLEDLHVAGGSLGGAIAVGLGAALPAQIRSVTGLGASVAPAPASAVPPAPADAEAVDALFDRLAREAVAPGRSEDTATTVRLLTNRHGAQVVTRVLRAAYAADATGWLPGVRCPALWVTGEHDGTCSPAEGRRIAERLGGRHVLLPGVGHLPMIEDPGLVLEHLLPHLRAADDPAPAG